MISLVKRVSALLMVLALVLPLLAACGNAGSGGDTSAQATEPAAGEATEAPAGEATEEMTEEMMTEEATMEMTEEATMEMTEETMTEETMTEETMTEEATSEGSSGGEAVTLPEVDPSAVDGPIVAAGSSTVFPLAQRMGEIFTQDGYTGQLTIDSIGSGAGFERFCKNAETDISDASRAIKEEETQQCQDNGREPIEFQIGIDALAVAVSSDNDFATDVTTEELAQIFSTAENWSDVRPDWPAEPIQRFIPGTDSGTFDFFVEKVLDEDPAPALNASNLQQSEDDNVLVQGIEGSPYAIGFFGYAYYDENQGQLKALSVDGVEPTADTAESGEYSLSRPLFMYTTADIMQEKPQVASFLNYVLSFVNDEIIDVGYFPVSEDTLNEQKQEWLDANGQ